MSKRTTSLPSSDSPSPRRRAGAKTAAENVTDATPKPRTRRKTAAPADTAAADSHPVAAATLAAPRPGQRPGPTHDEIAVRAYYIALERGFSSDPMADWLAAERELTGASA